VGTLNDRKEFRNPCSDQLAFVDAQSFVAHRLRANLEYEHQLDVALESGAQLS
jgi:hypothetical protein